MNWNDNYKDEEPQSDAYEENDEEEEFYDGPYHPSATNNDYSPACPWKAPGMSIKDFI